MELQKRLLKVFVVFLVIGCAYALIFKTPIYGLDLLTMAIVILLTLGVLVIVWEVSK